MRILFSSFGLLVCALSASMVFAGCAVECVATDTGGVCVDTYDTGYYYDSLVSGVSYENRIEGSDVAVWSGTTGQNGGPGGFRFLAGQTVAFSIGDTDLGESAGQERVTPFDLTGIEEEAVGGCEVDQGLPDDTDEFRKVAHLAVLLQTLDTDGDPTSEIKISPEVAALFDGVSIEIDQLWETFQTDLQAVLDDATSAEVLPSDRTIVEREDALKALYLGIGLCE
ncbi:MAG: hypothetical protein WBM48_15835 [Polyangiales bacterium]